MDYYQIIIKTVKYIIIIMIIIIIIINQLLFLHFYIVSLRNFYFHSAKSGVLWKHWLLCIRSYFQSNSSKRFSKY